MFVTFRGRAGATHRSQSVRVCVHLFVPAFVRACVYVVSSSTYLLYWNHIVNKKRDIPSSKFSFPSWTLFALLGPQVM